MHELIATKSLSYGGKRLEQGDDFKAKPRDARVLVALGKAKHAPVEDARPTLPTTTSESADLPAEESAPEPQAGEPAPDSQEPAPATAEVKSKGAAARREAKAKT